MENDAFAGAVYELTQVLPTAIKVKARSNYTRAVREQKDTDEDQDLRLPFRRF